MFQGVLGWSELRILHSYIYLNKLLISRRFSQWLPFLFLTFSLPLLRHWLTGWANLVNQAATERFCSHNCWSPGQSRASKILLVLVGRQAVSDQNSLLRVWAVMSYKLDVLYQLYPVLWICLTSFGQKLAWKKSPRKHDSITRSIEPVAEAKSVGILLPSFSGLNSELSYMQYCTQMLCDGGGFFCWNEAVWVDDLI